MSTESTTTTSPKRIVVNTKDGSVTVRLRNVRLSFPALFQPRSFEEGKEKTYQATFLMNKNEDSEQNITYLKQAIDEVVKLALKGNHPGPERVCLRDGAEKAARGVDGYAGMVFCSSSNKKPVHVVDQKLNKLLPEDGKPYAGCYVHATVRLWAQNNKFGKRVNAQLRAIMFYRDGEPFGNSSVNVEEEFEQVAGDDML